MAAPDKPGLTLVLQPCKVRLIRPPAVMPVARAGWVVWVAETYPRSYLVQMPCGVTLLAPYHGLTWTAVPEDVVRMMAQRTAVGKVRPYELVPTERVRSVERGMRSEEEPIRNPQSTIRNPERPVTRKGGWERPFGNSQWAAAGQWCGAAGDGRPSLIRDSLLRQRQSGGCPEPDGSGYAYVVPVGEEGHTGIQGGAAGVLPAADADESQ